MRIQRRDRSKMPMRITKKDDKKVHKGIIIINLLFAICIAVSYLTANVAVMIYDCRTTTVIKISLVIDAIILIIYLIAIRTFIKKYGVNKD